MTAPIQTDLPYGVLVSSDAGTPSALVGVWREPLELDAVLTRVAEFAAGPLGAASILARVPTTDLIWVQTELTRVEELARLRRAGKGLTAEPVPELSQPLARLRIAGAVLDGPELLAIRRTLAAARLVLAELRRVSAEAPQTAALEQPLPDKSLERRLEQALDDDGGLRDTASPALAEARSEIRTARDRLVQKLEAQLRAVGSDGGVTLRDGRYVIPVARDLRTRPDGIIHGESASGATLFLEPSAAIGLGNALREAESRARREELKVLRALSELLRPESATIAAAHLMCVAVDDLAARARWAVQVDGYAPAMATAPADLRIVNGRHPLLLDVRSAGPPRSAAEFRHSRTVVPFDLSLEGRERTVLLSGPNTGGKSVLLKAVGLHIALAQCGIVPPVGPGTSLPLVARIFADIGDHQSIAANLSTFSAHLTLLRVILQEADEQTLVLLDEIGSGTDPAEGGALAGAVLLALTERGCLTLATTHLGALKELATRSQGIVNASLQFDAATLQPTYRLLKGVPGRSYGIAIARRLGLPEAILVEAESQVPDRERSLDALLADVEQRERDQRIMQQELDAARAATAARDAALTAQEEAQTIRQAALKRAERDAERNARAQAREFLLEARDRVEAAIAKAEAASDGAAAREARRMVEEAAGHEAQALKALEAGKPAGREAGRVTDLQPGDRVRLDSGTAGDVLELRGDGKAVVRVGSLKLVVDAGSLTPLADSSRPPALAPSRPEPTEATTYEIDLRGQNGDEAEQSVLSALDAAVLAEQPYLRIIHGKGTGVVRDRVQQVVTRDRRVRAHGFAPANQGGTGVTVVEFDP